jgi:hypothetical protein
MRQGEIPSTQAFGINSGPMKNIGLHKAEIPHFVRNDIDPEFAASRKLAMT